ncbi:MAG: hypothetical protein MZV70_75330 [Desulfobacterales bacterium]|nr:hypothetical protein [Desulfobacterales bacterium]
MKPFSLDDLEMVVKNVLERGAEPECSGNGSRAARDVPAGTAADRDGRSPDGRASRIPEKHCQEPIERPHPGRKRHGKGTAGPPHPSAQPAERPSLRGRQLRGHPPHAARERDVRLRKGAFTGAAQRRDRQVRAGRPGDAAARRSERDGHAAPGEASAG